jgi:cyclopropane-fatty-acyl-phospholipid synthase
MSVVMRAMEKGLIPDPAIRYGIRKLCKERLRSLEQSSLELEQKSASAYIHALTKSPIAIHTQAANDQHYELPPSFFALVLGSHRKYSSGYWDSACKNLDDAEFTSLQITMERAELEDGMNILELGCGWGSLTLAMAQKFPRSTITALSNSAPQREWIESEAKKRGFKNIRIVTRNIAEVEDLSAEFGAFDRVVSVEMFEHLRNYEALFTRLSSWLKDDGKLFVHIFTHKVYSYFFETEGEDNWMGRYFFTGGQMPAHHLLAHFQKDLVLEEQWAWDGVHYSKTSEAWLDRLDANRDEVLRIFKSVYGDADAEIWVQRWRVFFMSCAELFGYREGTEWGVSHYRFCKRKGN